MVWSDQSQFPFFVYDNNGNLILTIDQNGLTLHGPHGNFYVKIDPASGQPIIALDNDQYAGYVQIDNNANSTLPYGSGLELKVINTNQTNFVAAIQATISGVVFLQGSDGGLSGLNGPLVALDGVSVQFKNSLNQSNPVSYSETTKWFEVQGSSGNGWHNMTFLNGWSAKAGYTPPSYKLCPDGFVRFAGTLTGGIIADNTAIMQFPITDAQIMPIGNTPMNPAIAPTGSGTASSRIYFPQPNPTSAFYCYGMGTGVTDICLDGCQYRVDHL